MIGSKCRGVSGRVLKRCQNPARRGRLTCKHHSRQELGLCRGLDGPDIRRALLAGLDAVIGHLNRAAAVEYLGLGDLWRDDAKAVRRLAQFTHLSQYVDALAHVEGVGAKATPWSGERAALVPDRSWTDLSSLAVLERASKTTRKRTAASSARRDRDEADTAVLSALRPHRPPGATLSQIRDQASQWLKADEVRRSVRRLVTRGEVVSTGRSHQVRYCLAPESKDFS